MNPLQCDYKYNYKTCAIKAHNQMRINIINLIFVITIKNIRNEANAIALAQWYYAKEVCRYSVEKREKRKEKMPISS